MRRELEQNCARQRVQCHADVGTICQLTQAEIGRIQQPDVLRQFCAGDGKRQLDSIGGEAERVYDLAR